MLPALCAVSSALDALQALTSSKSSSSPASGLGQASTSPFDLAGGSAASGSPTPACGAGGCSQISPETMSALLAAQNQASTASTTPAPTSRAEALKDLYSQLDTNGDGQVSKTEFEHALGAGGTNLAQADDVFSKLDTNDDGSVSLDELSSALQGKGHHHHHHHVASSDGSSGSDGAKSDPLLQALSGASSTQVSLQSHVVQMFFPALSVAVPVMVQVLPSAHVPVQAPPLGSQTQDWDAGIGAVCPEPLQWHWAYVILPVIGSRYIVFSWQASPEIGQLPTQESLL
jgi:Ca2+-binding EF-hand superfamily protein